jgi:hypothetical protein
MPEALVVRGPDCSRPRLPTIRSSHASSWPFHPALALPRPWPLTPRSLAGFPRPPFPLSRPWNRPPPWTRGAAPGRKGLGEPLLSTPSLCPIPSMRGGGRREARGLAFRARARPRIGRGHRPHRRPRTAPGRGRSPGRVGEEASPRPGAAALPLRHGSHPGSATPFTLGRTRSGRVFGMEGLGDRGGRIGGGGIGFASTDALQAFAAGFSAGILVNLELGRSLRGGAPTSSD